MIEHVFESRDEIINSIKSFYLTEILKQIYKIIGALDFVGNPSMVLSSFLNGVRDFFVTPSEALLHSPKNPSRVGMGVAKGTLSLFSNSASGIFGFLSKISALAGQMAASLSLDEDFQQWHRDVVVAEAKELNRQWKRRGVQSLQTIVTRPMYDVLNGFCLGLAGTVYRPYIGAKRKGGKGFVKGVASGVVGVVAKPVAGVCDAFSHLSGSVYDVAKSVNVLEKRYEPPRKFRMPHVFGPKCVLMPYTQVAAQSEFLLKVYPMKDKRGKSGKSGAVSPEIHVASEVLPMEPGVKTFAVVSSHRIVVFQVKRENGGVVATNLCWEVDLTRASSVSSKLQDHGHNGVAVIISTLAPKKKVKIAKVIPMPFSPESNVPMPDIGGTPVCSATPDVSQSSLYETPASAISLGDRAEDDLLMSERLGTKSSGIWEEAEGALTNGYDGVLELASKYNFSGSVKGRDGEILEWFSIIAEFQQRGQLTRIHNAICCVLGNFDKIIDDRGGSRKGSTEGFTSFGELYFGRDRAREAVAETPGFDKEVCEALNDLLWMHESQFQQFKLKPPEKQQKLIKEMKDSWVLSREVSATMEHGVPMWIVDARAKATFVPHEPPPLPDGLHEGDEVVSKVYTELEKGNISYDQARRLIASHSKSMMMASELHDSGLSTTSELNDLALDRLFEDTADDGDVGLDKFYSLKVEPADRPPSDLTYLDVFDRSTQSHAESAPGDFFASKSSLHFLDAMESCEAQSLADEGIELGDVYNDKENVSSSRVGDEEVGDEQLLQRTSAQPSLPTEDRPSGLQSTFPTEEAANQSPPVKYQVQESPSQENTPSDAKLDRLEAMLEQLLIMNARQAAQQNVFYQPLRQKEDPEIMMLRQEIEELRGQVQSKVTNNQRDELIAALRKEVSSLKHQLNEKDQKMDASKVDKTEDQVEGSSTASTNRVPEQLLMPELELKLKKQLSGVRKRLAAVRDGEVIPSPTIFTVHEEEDEDDDRREVTSV